MGLEVSLLCERTDHMTRAYSPLHHCPKALAKQYVTHDVVGQSGSRQLVY